MIPQRKPNLLVVDDVPENLRLLTRLLREHGYEVRPVPSGRLALQAVALDPPDLILLDINMPELDGFEVCERLKQDAAWMEIPVIFVSALDEVFDKVRAFGMGAVDYVSKPFEVEEILARVRTHLALRRTQRRLEEQIERMRELEALRESLFQMVVHDLRSPAWGIEHFIGRLAHETAGRMRPEAAVHLERVQKAAADLGRMVNSLLDVSRIEGKAMPIRPAVTEVRALVEAAVSHVGLAEPDREVANEVADGIRVRCDTDVMRRVLENLVGNGLKHTPAGTPLCVRAMHTEGGVRVEVIDRGAGVPPQDRERIFDKFGTVEARRRYATSGLGLAFCRLAVEAHGGRIGVEPAEGGGSTFWFELPL